MKFKLSLFLVFFLFFNFVFSQKIIEYQTGLGTKHPDNENVWILYNKVVAKHEGMKLYADSAHLDMKSKSFTAFKNVKINVNDTVFIYGDFLYYDGNEKVATITGKIVKLQDKKMTLVSDKLIFDRKINTAFYNTWGKTTENQNVLFSKIGEYHTQNRTFYFQDSVSLTNPKNRLSTQTLTYFSETKIAEFDGITEIFSDSTYIYTEKGRYDTKLDQTQSVSNGYIISENKKIKSDTLFYDKAKKIALANSNIEMTDSLNQIILTGGFSLANDYQQFAFITSTPTLKQIEKNDTLFLTADTIYATTDSVQNFKTISAFHNVKFFRKDIQGACDSMFYAIQDSTMSMFYNPIIWLENKRFTADTIHCIFKNNEISKIKLIRSALIISESQPAEFDQVKGNSITLNFENNQINLAEIEGNAESIYFIRDNDSSIIGINVGQSISLAIYFDTTQNISTITAFGNPKMKSFPIDKITNDDKFFKNFEWFYPFRPKNRDEIYEKKSYQFKKNNSKRRT